VSGGLYRDLAEARAVDLCADRRPADYRGRADSRGCRARAGVVLVRRSVRSSPARTDDESVRRASRRRPRRMRSGERFCATRCPCLRPQCSRQLLRQPLVLVSEPRVRPGRTGRRTAAAARCSGQTAVDANGNPQHPGDMAAQLTLVGDIPAWRPGTGHMLYRPKPDFLSSMGSKTPSVVGHPDGGGTDGIDPSLPLAP
jgi:hypothetical protein